MFEFVIMFMFLRQQQHVLSSFRFFLDFYVYTNEKILDAKRKTKHKKTEEKKLKVRLTADKLGKER